MAKETTICPKEAMCSVLFVCWGNICRSPTAEAIFKHLLKERGVSESWRVDSAGTGEWNIGELPDPRALHTLRVHGLDSDHRARVLVDEDFEQFEHIVVFDDKNIKDTLEMGPTRLSRDDLILLGTFDSVHDSNIIEDPYYSVNNEDFETTYLICERACKSFLESITS